jgi:hypothetical protein
LSIFLKMLDPISNQISNHAARRAADARRTLDKRARGSEKGERDEAVDSYDHRLARIEQAAASRPLADAAGEESLIERRSHGADPTTERDGQDEHKRVQTGPDGLGDSPGSGKRPPADPRNSARLDLTA